MRSMIAYFGKMLTLRIGTNMKVTAETYRALKGSIKKWHEIIKGTGTDNGARDCPLCLIFNNYCETSGAPCKGCPIYKDTKKRFCEGTPHVRWVIYSYIFSNIPSTGTTIHGEKSALAAVDMYRYLLELKGKCVVV